MGNGTGLVVNSIGSAFVTSPYDHNVTLTLNTILHVPYITKNLVSVSQFSNDNHVYFEFHSYSVLNLRLIAAVY